jgi:uncharacterized protein
MGKLLTRNHFVRNHMNQIFILMKPSSSVCNATCKYCFYEDVSSQRTIKNHAFMNEDTMENIIKSVLYDTEFDDVTFCFQGGEPLVIGISFYQKFIDEVNTYRKNTVVNYILQTNSILLDEQYCKLFKKYNFFLGISLDGVRKTNDSLRFFKDKTTGTFDSVMKKLKMLKAYQIDFNILTVLSSSLYLHAQEIYAFYKKENFHHVQYIPCLSSYKQKELDEFACTPRMYAIFYTKLFHYWLKDLLKGVYVDILLFADMILMFRGQKPMQCGMKGSCAIQCIIEADGSMYPCDFYALDKYKLGNINMGNIKEILRNDIAQSFLDVKPALESICYQCQFKRICNGGCKRQRQSFLGEDFCGQQEIFALIYDNYAKIEYALHDIQEGMEH